jgi:hypothetical protein
MDPGSPELKELSSFRLTQAERDRIHRAIGLPGR